MKLTKASIPNTLTCCNFLCGTIAVMFAIFNLSEPLLNDIRYHFAFDFDNIINSHTTGNYTISLLFILLGALFDFFDGMAARALKVDNPIGKDLDSLADATTFGLAPTFILVSYLYYIIEGWAFIALLMAAFSILRLAKFNNDSRQTTSFIGLATPANAIFWAAAITTVAYFNIDYAYPKFMGWIIIILTLISSYLLVSEIPFFSLKFHNFKWQGNQIRFIFIIGTAIIILTAVIIALIKPMRILIIAAIGCTIIYYIILALIDDIIKLIRK